MTRHARTGIALLSFMTCLYAARAEAQRPPAGPGPATRPAERPLLEKMRTARILLFTDEMALDTKGAMALERALDSFDVEERAARKTQGELRKQVETLAHSPAATEAQVVSAIDALRAGRAHLEEIAERRIRAVEGVLSPAQAAAFVLAEPKVDGELGRMVKQARGAARARRKGAMEDAAP